VRVAAPLLLLGALLAATGAGGAGTGTITFVGGSRQVDLIGDEAAIPEGVAEKRAAMRPHVEAAARSCGLDPALVDLVIRIESGYDPRAVSPKGARGLMQLLPATARSYGVSDIFDARENIGAGTRYLSDLMRRFDSDLELALAAYNAGPEAVERYRGVPPYPETLSYVRRILNSYRGPDAVRLGGGFGRPTAGRVPVTLSRAGSTALVSNLRRAGEAQVPRQLSLR
jgi:hypothetical protein